MEVEAVVCRGRLGEGQLNDRKKGGRVIGRNHDSETVESSPVTFREACGDQPRQGGRDLVWIARRVEDVHEELPADIDARKPGVLVAVDCGVGAVNRPQNFVRTSASKGGADEGL